jgi:serine/threonine protein phosphatase 1
MSLSVVRQLLRSFLTPRMLQPQSSEDVSSLAPEVPLYVVGDIHGCADLLKLILTRIETDAGAQDHAALKLIFLGDYIDRGDASAETLVHLRSLNLEVPNAVKCLMGNHERMMLDFLDDPAGRGGRWLSNGGLQTLASYRIGGISANASAEDLTEVSDALAAALPEGMEAWLRSLPLWIQSGNVICVHAAMNPERPPETQDERALLWGHRDFKSQPRDDGLWVIHGHTVVKKPQIENGRIAIDTGAWHSRKLTAAVITPGECRFL